MRIVGALDVHRSQITFRWQDMETGEVRRGRIVPAAREVVQQWLAGFGPADMRHRYFSMPGRITTSAQGHPAPAEELAVECAFRNRVGRAASDLAATADLTRGSKPQNLGLRAFVGG